ncbi:MAG: hypothetical protein ACKOWJ_02950 [Micrococcales bacterium]
MKRLALRTYLTLSVIAAIFLGVIFYFGTGKLETAFIAGGITFIVTVIVIATLDMSAKENPSSPDQPHLK